MEIHQKGRQQETISRKSVKGLVIGHEFPCAKAEFRWAPESPLQDPYFHSRGLPSSVQFNLSVVSDSLQPHGLQHARLRCPSPSPRACSNSCLLSQWCHPTISSSVVPFSSHPQSFPASGSLLAAVHICIVVYVVYDCMHCQNSQLYPKEGEFYCI